MQGERWTTGNQTQAIPKLSRRFRPKDYLKEYTTLDSEDFNTRVTELYSLFEEYLTNRNDSWWAGCCQCFVRKGHKNDLGHPQADLVSVKDLIKIIGVDSKEKLNNFLKHTLQWNDAHTQILLPQCNMRHEIETTNSARNPTPVESHDQHQSESMYDELPFLQLEPIIQANESRVSELEATVKMQKEELEQLKAQVNAHKLIIAAYQVKWNRVDARVDGLEGANAVALIKGLDFKNMNQEISRMKEEISALKESNNKLLNQSNYAEELAKRCFNWAKELENILMSTPTQVQKCVDEGKFPVYMAHFVPPMQSLNLPEQDDKICKNSSQSRKKQ